MRYELDLTTTAGRFRIVALAEAFSWVGLLVGMCFKYLGSPRTEIGVKIFGPVHGALFVAFLAVMVLTGIAFRWNPLVWLLALLGSFVPLGTVMFVMWADRRGKLGQSVTGDSSGAAPVPNLSP
jgi:integral membrane protein